jgi:riboflavin-specific deaminase-like protein
MRRLHPEPPAELSVPEALAGLRPWEDPPDERPYTLVNFALTLDGRATIDGRSGPIGSDSDTAMLVGLRTRVDAVMIGAGTMRAERYGRLVPDPAKRERREREGLPHDPLAVIVSESLDLPWDAKLFTAGWGRVLLFTSSESEPPPTATSLRVVRHPGGVDLAEALRHLRTERGVRALLCEGGPHLHADLHAAGLVDELFVTHAPKLAGGEGPRLVEGLAELERPLELAWLLHEPQTGELFARYLVPRAGASQA